MFKILSNYVIIIKKLGDKVNDSKKTIIEKTKDFEYYIEENQNIKSIICKGNNFYRSHGIGKKNDYDHLLQWQLLGKDYFLISKVVSSLLDKNDILIEHSVINENDPEHYQKGHRVSYCISTGDIDVISLDVNKSHKRQDLKFLSGDEYYNELINVIDAFEKSIDKLTWFDDDAKDVYKELLSAAEMVKQHAI